MAQPHKNARSAKPRRATALDEPITQPLKNARTVKPRRDGALAAHSTYAPTYKTPATTSQCNAAKVQ